MTDSITEEFEADLSQFKKLNRSIRDQVKDVRNVIARIRSKFLEDERDSSSGITFLELKNQLLLTYLQGLTLLMLRKISGESIENDPAILRIVEIRTVLERMRPMEIKLKYHIDKILKAGTNDQLDYNDPLKFRPNPDQLMEAAGEDEDDSADEVNEDAGDDDGTLGKKSDVYLPPRLAPVPYNFDETPKDRLQKQADRAKKRALHSSIIQELRQEYYDEPEEIHDQDIYRMKSNKQAKEREAYEEKNMIRLNVSKKEKAKARKMTTMNSLAHLADFNDFRNIAGEEGGGGDSFGATKTKKRRKTLSKKGRKGKKVKRHH